MCLSKVSLCQNKQVRPYLPCLHSTRMQGATTHGVAAAYLLILETAGRHIAAQSHVRLIMGTPVICVASHPLGDIWLSLTFLAGSLDPPRPVPPCRTRSPSCCCPLQPLLMPRLVFPNRLRPQGLLPVPATIPSVLVTSHVPPLVSSLPRNLPGLPLPRPVSPPLTSCWVYQ